MTAILVVASLTLAASFLCSLLEAALYAVTPSQLEAMTDRGVFGARRFAQYRADVEEPIAAILTLNTIAHTVGSAVTGAMVGSAYGDAAVGWFAGIFTFLVLLITEIVPKSIGVRHAQTLVPYLVWPLQLVIWISWPVARPAKWLMRKLVRQTGPSGPDNREVAALARMALRAGRLGALEAGWVENALDLEKVTAADLMTPRTVVQSIQADRSVGEVIEELRDVRVTRLPAYEGEQLDQLIGFIHRTEVYDAFARGQADRPLRELARPLKFVPEGIKAPRLLDIFLRDHSHMVAVFNEYGGFQGVVTLEDVLEQILGQEIVDERDEHEDMQEHARRRAAQRGVPTDPVDDPQ